MFMFFMLCVIGFGLARLGKLAKDNPSQTMQAASWIKQMFGK